LKHPVEYIMLIAPIM